MARAYRTMLDYVPKLDEHLGMKEFEENVAMWRGRLREEYGKGNFNHLDLMWSVLRDLRHKKGE